MRLLTTLFALFTISNAYKILIYSGPVGFSHIQLMESVATTLQKAGHDVVVVHPILEEKFRQQWEKSPAKKIYLEAPEHIRNTHDARTENIWITPPLGGNLRTVRHLMSIQQQLCDAVLNHTEVLDSLRKEQFDVGIFELFGACGLGIGEIVGVKSHIMMSAIGVVDSLAPMFHSPFMASYVPASMTLYTDEMSFFQRFINIIWVSFGEIIYKKISIDPYERIYASHGYNIDTYQVIREKTNFILANSDEFLDLARPLSRKVKHIGGIALGQMGKLNEDFDRLLSLRPKGSVVISFGSVAPTSSMPEIIKNSILKTIKEFPEYTFIWKTDKQDLHLSKDIENLETNTWMQQRELLNDPRVKLFVTHAGLNSILETTKTGTPAILVPIFGDQFKNAGHMSRKDTSIVIEKDRFTAELFREAVGRILNDPGYAERALRLSELIRTRKETPTDRLLEAVEFSGKFGKIHDLDVYGFEMGFIQYFCIDVILLWISLFAIVFYFISKCFTRILCNTKVKKE